MTGPEHYTEAERLIALAREAGGDADQRPYSREHKAPALILADAQVHATLALAAATALSHSDPDIREWRKVAGATPGGPQP